METCDKNSKIKCAQVQAGHYRAELVLVLLTLLWGSTFTAVKVLLEQLSFSWLLFYRFGIGVLVLTLFCLIKRVRLNVQIWRSGLILSLFLFVGYLSQTIGLQTTTASKSAFITSMVVVFVPVLSVFLEKRFPRFSSIMGIFIAVFGLILLVQPQGGGIASGDIWTLMCAITWAVYIVQLQVETSRHNNLALLWVQMIGMTFLCLLAIPLERMLMPQTTAGWLPDLTSVGLLVYLALGCTLLTTGLQTFFQKGTTSTRAALIYTAEPVFASAIAWVWLGERFTRVQWLGALLIIAGVLFSELYPEKSSASGGELDVEASDA